MSEITFPTIRAIASALEQWAPTGSSQPYDNVGLQVGDADARVARALLALDMTPQVLEEAVGRKASLVITHHPLLFKPLKQVTADRYESSIVLGLAEEGIALYSIHTNLDAAPGGVSFALAEQLGIQDATFIEGFPESLYKVAVFVPTSHREQVHMAMAEAGAGHIGEYEACAFTTAGIGYFRPGDNTKPFIGEAGGDLESAEEIRLEMEVPRWILGRVLSAMRSAHPYEEVAYDVYPVEQKNTRAGLGAIGTLQEPMVLHNFLSRIAERLDAASLRYAGDPEAIIERVAVCGGAGSSFVHQALRAGADAYVTADVKYHDFFNVLDPAGKPRMAFIDAGHYETEALTEVLLRDWLRERFPEVEWRRTDVRTSPMRTYVARAQTTT